MANISDTGRTAKELETLFLEEAGVATVAGTSFGAEGEGYVRFSYANSVDNIREAMHRIRRCLETNPRHGTKRYSLAEMPNN